MTINNRDRRSRVRTEPLPDILEPLDPECFVQQLSEVMGELKLNMKAMDELAKRQQSRNTQPTTPPKRRKSRRTFRPWWQDI